MTTGCVCDNLVTTFGDWVLLVLLLTTGFLCGDNLLITVGATVTTGHSSNSSHQIVITNTTSSGLTSGDYCWSDYCDNLVVVV